jgi:hypothetical protein
LLLLLLLDSFYVDVPMWSLFVTLSILSDDAIDSFHIQILMKVVISNVPRSIHDTMDYSILESLYDISVALAGTTPKLNTISAYWLEILLLQQVAVPQSV